MTAKSIERREAKAKASWESVPGGLAVRAAMPANVADFLEDTCIKADKWSLPEIICFYECIKMADDPDSQNSLEDKASSFEKLVKGFSNKDKADFKRYDRNWNRRFGPFADCARDHVISAEPTETGAPVTASADAAAANETAASPEARQPVGRGAFSAGDRVEGNYSSGVWCGTWSFLYLWIYLWSPSDSSAQIDR